MLLRIVLLGGVLLGSLPAESTADANPLQRALTLFNHRKYQECFEVIAPYVQQNPTSAAGHKLLGMDEYMLGRPRDALLELQRATELAPNDAEAFYYLGRLHFTADNAVAALGAFHRAIELDPSSVRAYNHLGQSYEALNRPEDAERVYRKAIEIDQGQPKKSEWPYYNLGLLYLNRGHANEAAPYFRKALANNPGFPEAKMKLAAVLVKQHLAAEALDLLEQVVRSDPENAEAHYRLALLLRQSEKQEEAQQQFALFEKYRKR